MEPRSERHLLVGELRFATVPSIPRPLLRQVSDAFQLRLPRAASSTQAVPEGTGYLLRAADGSWALRLEPSALALETRADDPL